MAWQEIVFSLQREMVNSLRGQRFFLMDFEILGAFGKRRADFKYLIEHNEVKVINHVNLKVDVPMDWRQADFQALKKLGNFAIETSEAQIEFNLVALKYFEFYFPFLAKKMKAQWGVFTEKLLQDYLLEYSSKTLLLADVWIYFLPFLRQRFPQEIELHNLCLWESALLNLDTKDFGKLEINSFVQKNPSLNVLNLMINLPDYRKEAGQWALYLDRDFKMQHFKMRPEHALAIDLLDHDWSMNREDFVTSLQQEILKTKNFLFRSDQLMGQDFDLNQLLLMLKQQQLIYVKD